MNIRPPEHELHRRRLGRNLGLGGALLLFVFLVFGMTIEKVKDGAPAAAMLGQAPASSAGAVKPAGGGIAVKAVSSSETGTTSGGGN